MSLVQLLGRWTSSAIQRYTQDSALVRVPQIPQQILTPDQQPGTIQLTMAASASQPEPVVVEGPVTTAARPKATASNERGLRAELEKLREAIARPGETFVFRRARILHRASTVEDHNIPSSWRTTCGWTYGLSTFLRTSSVQDGTRRCKKCFDLNSSSDSSSDSESSGITVFEESSASSAE